MLGVSVGAKRQLVPGIGGVATAFLRLLLKNQGHSTIKSAVTGLARSMRKPIQGRTSSDRETGPEMQQGVDLGEHSIGSR